MSYYISSASLYKSSLAAALPNAAIHNPAPAILTCLFTSRIEGTQGQQVGILHRDAGDKRRRIDEALCPKSSANEVRW